MSKRIDEIETAMHSCIYDVSPVQSTLVLQVILVLGIDVLDDGAEALYERNYYFYRMML